MHFRQRMAQLRSALGLDDTVRQVVPWPRQSQDSDRPRVLIIAPGSLPVPPDGWGAIETIIGEQWEILCEHYNVALLNSQRVVDWIRCRPWRADVVVVHQEHWLPHALALRGIFGSRIIAVSHYPYLSQPDMWPSGFGRVMNRMRKCDAFVSLSPAITQVMLDLECGGAIVTAPNGTSLHPREGGPASRSRAICLGAVTPRKRQVDLALALSDAAIDFVGPIEDARLLCGTPNADDERFLGPWSREQVQEQLTAYSVLVLLSDGEADALVLYEAQMCGLDIVVSAEALGGQDPTLPWVHVVDPTNFAEVEQAIEQAMEDNVAHRRDIVEYAYHNYRWETRLVPILRLIDELADRHSA